MNRYFENGVMAQQRAMTLEESKKQFERTCSGCHFVAHCEPFRCPVKKEHEERKTYLETGLQNRPLTICFPAEAEEVVEPQKKDDWKKKAFRAIMRYLDKCSDVASAKNDDDLVELLDDVTVQLSISKDFDSLLPLMKKYELIYYKAARLYWKYEKPEGGEKLGEDVT